MSVKQLTRLLNDEISKQEAQLFIDKVDQKASFNISKRGDDLAKKFIKVGLKPTNKIIRFALSAGVGARQIKKDHLGIWIRGKFRPGRFNSFIDVVREKNPDALLLY